VTTGPVPVEQQADVCDLRTVQRTAALLGHNPGEWKQGDILPRGWHFAFFIPAVAQSDLPEDGFPAPVEPGIAIPEHARVMLGGRTAEFRGDIAIGQMLRRDRQVVDVTNKNGRSGPLTIVTRRHDIYAGHSSEPVIVEHEDMVYRAPSPVGGSVRAESGAVERSGAFRADFQPGPVELFRYSALTFNGHRIHFDAPYATSREGYPALVINGGLTALALVELFRREAGRDPVRTATRNRGPLFCGAPATLNATCDGAEWKLWAANATGAPSIEMIAR
jgi:3-methylfumaryl-CoA hydratase